MRVLMLSSPFPTHFTPLVPLAWALRAAGHDLVVAGQPDIEAAVHGAGLCSARIGHRFHPLDGMLGALPEGMRPIHLTGPTTPEMITAGTRAWAIHAKYLLPYYEEFAREWGADLIVSEQMDSAGLLVGAALGVPAVQHRWGIDTLGDPTHEVASQVLAGAARRAGVDRLPQPALLLDPCPPELQVPGIRPGTPIRHVPYNGTGSAPSWLRERGGAKRVVVSLGSKTLEINGLSLFQGIISAFAGLDGVEAVVTADARFHESLGALPSNVRLVTPTPLHLFLDKADVIVHHAGANTCMTAAGFGLPQLVMPQLADEFNSGDRVAAAGAGITFPEAAQQDDPQAVREAIVDLVSDERYTKNARELRESMRAMPSPAEVVSQLEALVG